MRKIVLLVALIAVGLNVESAVSADTVKIVSSNAKSFQLQTGKFVLNFAIGKEYISIANSDVRDKGQCLALRPGGEGPGLRMLDAANIKTVVSRRDKDGVRSEITGLLDWCSYRVKIFLPSSRPGLINSQVEVFTKSDVGLDKQLFTGQHYELDYISGRSGDKLGIFNRMVQYFNGTPGADTYHVVKPKSGAIADLNQFIYYADPTVLKASVLFYEDFTSLNPFFKATGTRILNSVRQPPGCLRTPMIHNASQSSTFGFDVPAVKKPMKKGQRLILANSLILLIPETPQINDPVSYCRNFVEGISSIYPYIEKPKTKFIDWPSIAEQGFDDMVANAKKSGRGALFVQCNLNNSRRYAERFDSERAKKMVAGADTALDGFILRLPWGDAWQYFFPMAMAGDYYEEFGSEAGKRACLREADDVVRAGRALNYLFTMRINPDLTKPNDIYGSYEYDCTGTYIYLMLLYHRITGDAKYLAEAKAAGEQLLKMGFEYPFGGTTMAMGPIAMLRLYKATNDKRFLDGVMIPMAALLRHSWFFNPDYGDYRGRTIFLLTEGMPGVYANGWEEATMLRCLNDFLVQGYRIIPDSSREMTSELLRWKGISAADSLAPLLPDKSIIYTGIPREWVMPVDHSWNIPLEGFGYLEWDASGMHDKPGRVSQGPYCFGMVPEAAVLLFHPLNKKVTLYVEAPIIMKKKEEGKYVFATLAGKEPFRAALQGEGLAGASVWVKGAGNKSSKVVLKKDSKNGRLWFRVIPRKQYMVTLSK